ncbi:MAG: hypothetical protein QOJ03_2130, partial [Frankiaceae bacterium]|nr:hypothetical protein [Frankiaceae bacterium]
MNANADQQLLDTAKRAATVAMEHADEVDRAARFPTEAVDVLK